MKLTEAERGHAALLEAGYEAQLVGETVQYDPSTPPEAVYKAWLMCGQEGTWDDFVAWMVSPLRAEPEENANWFREHGIIAGVEGIG